MVPDNMVIPILTGPLRGKKWIVGSHNNSAWLGTYESVQTATFVEKSKDQQIFWDLGAHAGYYTLLFKHLNRDSKVYSFEPVEGNYTYFQQHMKLNKIKNLPEFVQAELGRNTDGDNKTARRKKEAEREQAMAKSV